MRQSQAVDRRVREEVMQSTCSSILQRTLKPKQLFVDVSSLSSYVHNATGACTPTLSTQQASLNLCAKTCQGSSSCFLVAVEASNHRSMVESTQ